jgi:hypothetical protein
MKARKKKMTQFDKMCEVLGIQMDKETKAEILAGDLELVLIWNEEDGSLTDWGCN